VSLPVRLLHVVGTRPNFMKAAAVIAAAKRWNQATPATGSAQEAAARVGFEQVLVHTGQHYDEQMSRVFFDDLGLPRPDYDLGVGSGSHAEQTARVMLALEPVILKETPALVMTVGDVNSTLAAALVAAKLQIPAAHVEAGLRSRDRSMPEELNRLVTDQLSDANLVAEGISVDRIHFVGNTMIDTLEAHLPRALERGVLAEYGLRPSEYAVVTLHRPSNVDHRAGLEALVDMIEQTAQRLPVVFPVHARTRKRLGQFGLWDRLERNQSIKPCAPLGYLDFLGLLAKARLVLTDSGGIQEETTILGVPCLTLRANTERPVTITEGTNRLVDPGDIHAVLAASDEVLAAPPPGPRRPELWDGLAADRIVQVVAHWAQRV
jgi:UDP-N-acetylglucosamine 2-epimerase (non-hydrolysing)